MGSTPITHFPETETFRAAEYLEAHPTAILVSTPDHIEELRKALDWNIRISKHESARHVYLTSPVKPSTSRVAERNENKNF